MKRALTLEISCDTYHQMNATGWWRRFGNGALFLSLCPHV